MALDLSDRIIQPAPPKAVKLHPIRRWVQILCGALLVLLPFSNIARVDLQTGRFWLLGQQFTNQNLILVFFVAAIAVVTLLAVSMLYGRWWCGWVCPQTLVSDYGDSLRTRIDRLFKSKQSSARAVASSAAWSFLMALTAVATGASVISFFYSPGIVWHSTLSPSFAPGVATAVYIFAGITTADLLFVRRNFCKSACPYGPMLSLIGDRDTLTVRYLWERGNDCIACHKCEVVCPMGIDIKQGANQMECIGCGECIDACNDVLPLLKKDPKAGLMELRYGVDPMRRGDRLTMLQKLGLWDGRRLFVLTVLGVLVIGLLRTVFGTSPTRLQIVPMGSIIASQMSVQEGYGLVIMNGEPRSTQFDLRAAGLADLRMVQPISTVTVPRGAELRLAVVLSAPASEIAGNKRYPIEIDAVPLDDPGKTYRANAIFFLPRQNR